MIVYRVEHPKNKLGPYQYRIGGQRKGVPVDIQRERLAHRPSPAIDPVFASHTDRLLNGNCYVYAFLSKKDVLSWFNTDDELSAISRAGFQVRAYEVSEGGWGVVIGRTQAAFRRTVARKVQSWAFDSFVEEFSSPKAPLANARACRNLLIKAKSEGERLEGVLAQV